MKFSRMLGHAALQALGVAVYVGIVAWVMSNGERLFGSMPGMVGPMVLLMLLVLSAAVVGSLIFGRAAYLLLTGAKKEGIALAITTIGVLAVFTIIGFVILALTSTPLVV